MTIVTVTKFLLRVMISVFRCCTLLHKLFFACDLQFFSLNSGMDCYSLQFTYRYLTFIFSHCQYTWWLVYVGLSLTGVCLGMQCAVIEFSRNVCGWKDAHSSEFYPDSKKTVVIDMPEHNQGQMGGTMRLGRRKTIFNTKDSVLCKFTLHSFAHHLSRYAGFVSVLSSPLANN